MPPPLDKAVREAILKDIRAGALSRNAIARKHAVSTTSVSNVAKAAMVSEPFSREQTQDATRAREADNASRRASLAARRIRLAERLHDTAEKLLWQVDQPQLYFDWGGKDHEYDERTQPEPTPADKRALVGAAAVAIDKSLKLAPPEQDQQGLAAVDQWLRSMMGGSDNGD